jgi:hypothetical protein
MQFLKNFYTVLDFENNIIRIGVNAAGPSAKSGATGIKESSTSASEDEAEPSNTFVIILLVVFVAIISFFVYKRYKEDKQHTQSVNASVSKTHNETMAKLQK